MATRRNEPWAPKRILPFRIIRVNSEDEVIARANDLIVGRAAYETAVRLYPKDTIQYREGARIIARSEPKASRAWHGLVMK
jgi:hypothetical protein